MRSLLYHYRLRKAGVNINKYTRPLLRNSLLAKQKMENEGVTLSIRLIRSFEYRNVKNIVLKDIPLSWTAKQLQEHIESLLPNQTGLPPPFKKFAYDTLKIEHHAHGAKTNDTVINLEDDDKLILKAEQPLRDVGIRHESEISFFKMADYVAYKNNPVVKWE